MRTFYREPDAVFWTYGFPLILTVLLGIAFRNRQPEVIDVAIEQSPAAIEIKSRLDENKQFNATVLDPAECQEHLRLGKVAIVVRPGDTVEYRYDPTRPESALARAKLDDALQRAFGRTDPKPVSDREVAEPGAR